MPGFHSLILLRIGSIGQTLDILATDTNGGPCQMWNSRVQSSALFAKDCAITLPEASAGIVAVKFRSISSIATAVHWFDLRSKQSDRVSTFVLSAIDLAQAISSILQILRATMQVYWYYTDQGYWLYLRHLRQRFIDNLLIEGVIFLESKYCWSVYCTGSPWF